MNVTAMKRVKGILGVDLTELGTGSGKPEDQLIVRLWSDPIFLCDVIYCMCKDQADAEGISDEDFGKAMAGDAIDHATTALLEEIVDSSPNPRDRKRARRVLEKTTAMIGKAHVLLDARMAAKLDDGTMERQMAEAIDALGT